MPLFFHQVPSNFTEEFRYLTQASHPTWHDLYVIFSLVLTLKEKERFWVTTKAHADDVHHRDSFQPVEAETTFVCTPTVITRLMLRTSPLVGWLYVSWLDSKRPSIRR